MGKSIKQSGVFWGLFALTLFMFGLGGRYFRTGLYPAVNIIGALILGALSFLFLFYITRFILNLVGKRPSIWFTSLLANIGSLYILKSSLLRLPDSILNTSMLMAIPAFALLGYGLQNLIKKDGIKKRGISFTILGLVGLFILNIWFWQKGEIKKEIWSDPNLLALASSFSKVESKIDPKKGNYDFDYFTYGSANNSRRGIFNEQVRYTTPTIDASLMLPEWKGKKKKWRERFWGFGVDSFPLNAHVWMPVSTNNNQAQFPLVMIVHGNHSMEHYSDPGYAYLGELLASRGNIVVSVDENFINGTWSGDFRGKEMPTRAWVLLKHLELWRTWNISNTDLKDKVDLSNIVLIGHSRGGEAVAIAKAYNDLERFPDDANQEFDFNFGIKGIVTIAPTDKRYFRRMALQDVHYLTLQGSYDSDESSFFGRRIGDRITYTDTFPYINAGVMLHGANHGQFNSIWGNMDMGPPSGWLLNTNALMDGKTQRNAAQLYISAFVELVCKQNSELNVVFKHDWIAKRQLKHNELLHYFTQNNEKVLANFESDIDVTTTLHGEVQSNNLPLWKEEVLRYRDSDWQDNKSLILGWRDTTNAEAELNPSWYQIAFNDPIIFSENSQLRFDLSPGKKEWLPKLKKANKDKKVKKKEEKDEEEMIIDFTIELVDTAGIVHQTKLSENKQLAPKLNIHYYRHQHLNSRLGDEWEPTLESCYLPFTAFSNIDSSKQIAVQSIRLRFDQTKEGVIILDNLGIGANN